MSLHLGLIVTADDPDPAPLAAALLARRPDLTLSLISDRHPPPLRDDPRLRRVVVRTDGLRRSLALWEKLGAALPSWRGLVVHGGNRLVERLLWGEEPTRWSRRRPRLVWTLVLVLGPILAPLAWLVSLVNQALFGFLLPTLAFPLHAARFLLEEGGRLLTPQKQANALGCDLWLRMARTGHDPVLIVGDNWDPKAGRTRAVPLPHPPALVRDRGLSGPVRAPLIANLGWEQRIAGAFLLCPGPVTAPVAELLIQALRSIRTESGTALELVCLGRKPFRLAADLQQEPVHWLGAVKDAEREKLYRQARLTLVLGGGDRDGRSLLPPLRQGCPIVCADVPAIRDLLTAWPESVLFFNPEDVTAIARAVCRTLAQRDRFRQRQQEAYRRLAGRDWSAVAADVLRLADAWRGRPAPREVAHAA